MRRDSKLTHATVIRTGASSSWVQSWLISQISPSTFSPQHRTHVGQRSTLKDHFTRNLRAARTAEAVDDVWEWLVRER